MISTLSPSSCHLGTASKRPADDYSSETHHAKRPRASRANSACAGFSELEKAALGMAASILGVSVEKVMALKNISNPLAPKAAVDMQPAVTECQAPPESQPGQFNLSLPDRLKKRKRCQPQQSHDYQASAPIETQAPQVTAVDDFAISLSQAMQMPTSSIGIFSNNFPFSTNQDFENISQAASDFSDDWLQSFSWDPVDPVHMPPSPIMPVSPKQRVSPSPVQRTVSPASLHEMSPNSHPAVPVNPQPIPTHLMDGNPQNSTPYESRQTSVEVVSLPGPRGGRRGPFQDEEKRRETALTRRLGACIRCSMQRIKCIPNPDDLPGCCKTCIQAAPTSLHFLPCYRYKIVDAELLDHAKCPRPTWTLRWKKMEVIDIPARDWTSDDTPVINVTQDVGGMSYPMRVRSFKPAPGDSLERKWVRNGQARSFETTPYAIADMKEAAQTLADFADRTLGAAIAHYIDESDPLLRGTYTMAYHYSKFAERDSERELLKVVLRLWNASRMESRSDRICGGETLGMSPQDYGSDDPNTGLILTSPVFSAQLEVIVTAEILRPAKDQTLKGLKKLIMEGQRRSWFTVYLAMFILLHSCALLTAGDNKKARKQGLDAAKFRFYRQSVVESLHNGAKILLAYFHYCSKGSHPFSMDWSSPDQVARAELNSEQVEFMRQTARELKKKEVLFREIRKNDMFEHDYYFVSQLYDREWRPRHTVV